MNWQEYRFPYLIHDGACYGAKWIGDTITMTICRYYLEGEPNEIEVQFCGVEWARSTCAEEEPYDSYDPDIPIEEYPLIDQVKFQEDYKEFVAYGLLDTIRYLDENVIFIDDIMLIKCHDMRILRAVCNPDIGSTVERIF